MAKQLGVSKAYLSQFENGLRKGNRRLREAYAALDPSARKKKNGKNGTAS